MHKRFFPFSEINGTEFLSTLQHKESKFVTKRKKFQTQQNVLENRLNDVFNESDFPNALSYYNTSKQD